MEERELAFSTFLKLLELKDPQKASTLRGFKRGGGFNYWRPLQTLAPEVVGGKLDLSGMQEKVALMAKGHQRKYNDQALTNLLKWVSRRRLALRSRPRKVVKKFGNSGLRVRLEPEVAFTMDRRNYFMHLWATNNPSLSEETLSMGLYYFRHHFQNEGHTSQQFLIFDTVKDRIFAEFNILVNAPEMLGNQQEIISNIWSSIDDENEAPRPGKTPDERPSERPGARH